MVPRVFSRHSASTIKEWTIAGTQETIHLIMKARRQSVSGNGPMSLHPFVLQYFLKTNESIQEAIDSGISFVLACQKYSMRCCTADCFWKIFQSQLTEPTYTGLETYTDTIKCFMEQFSKVTCKYNINSLISSSM